MAKVSRSIGLRGSEKKEQTVETQAAAPGAIRQIDPNARPAQQAGAGDDRLDRQPDERRPSRPAIVELRQPVLRVPLNAIINI